MLQILWKLQYEITASGIALHIKHFFFPFSMQVFNYSLPIMPVWSVILLMLDMKHWKISKQYNFQTGLSGKMSKICFACVILDMSMLRRSHDYLKTLPICFITAVTIICEQKPLLAHMHCNGHLIVISTVGHFLFIMIHLDPQAGET